MLMKIDMKIDHLTLETPEKESWVNSLASSICWPPTSSSLTLEVARSTVSLFHILSGPTLTPHPSQCTVQVGTPTESAVSGRRVGGGSGNYCIEIHSMRYSLHNNNEEDLQTLNHNSSVLLNYCWRNLSFNSNIGVRYMVPD